MSSTCFGVSLHVQCKGASVCCCTSADCTLGMALLHASLIWLCGRREVAPGLDAPLPGLRAAAGLPAQPPDPGPAEQAHRLHPAPHPGLHSSSPRGAPCPGCAAEHSQDHRAQRERERESACLTAPSLRTAAVSITACFPGHPVVCACLGPRKVTAPAAPLIATGQARALHAGSATCGAPVRRPGGPDACRWDCPHSAGAQSAGQAGPALQQAPVHCGPQPGAH